MESDESLRRKRRVAFIVITLIFVISVAALVYWAVNIATACLDEDTSR